MTLNPREADFLQPGDLEALDKLRIILRELGSLAVAFSGGVDSTFLLAVAHETLKDKALAITAVSPTYLEEELEEAKKFCSERGIPHEIVESNELEIPGFAENPENRCYFCKSELFQKCREAAFRRGIEHVADGTNLDDLGDYRPGMKAGDEACIKRPLLEAGMDKARIRRLSRLLNLPTWNKPQLACLSSRFPYGTEITEERLKQVAAAERALKKMGFRQFRVRYHGELARVEVSAEEMDRLLDPGLRKDISRELKAAGFTYVALDLEGYRAGSMNEMLARREKEAGHGED